MIEPRLRRGYTILMVAFDAGLSPAGWIALTADLLQLPGWMAPAVQLAVDKGAWRRANDPIKSVRENAYREAGRIGLNAEQAVPKGE